MSDFLPELSEADKNHLTIQRERSNKISKLMGDYLLKGYKMLGLTCNKCQAILLEDRQGVQYCVGCEEVDVKTEVLPSNHVIERSQPLKQVPSSSSFDDLLQSSVDAIKLQISWASQSLEIPILTIEQRSQYVVFIKTCYETLHLLQCDTK